MLPDMVGGVSAGRAANLEVSGEALATFVKRVDAVLSQLEKSAGNPVKVGAQSIRAASLASGGAKDFPEAHGLYTQYHRVHAELTSFSKSLHLQIEAIGIAVQGAHRGFDNLEEEQRRRFWSIQREVDDLEQVRKRGRTHGKQGAAQHDDDSRTSGGL
ncbi:hypothetical protein KUM39_04220 [Streptomyces sp. J2-1]|uniref:hypothetical protein n=1 Tax=Streptomyces corallincola TaxID=2851888 RepID=UPI001C38004B|nr:hypothetical protein [Streptomyces corallincola]MBV2353570.1 hypothetical protein [Streptomyces corallincola]